MLSSSVASLNGRTAEYLIFRALLQVKRQREARIRKNIARLHDAVAQAEKALHDNDCAYHHVIQTARTLSSRTGMDSVEQWQRSRQDMLQLRDDGRRLAARAGELAAWRDGQKEKLSEQEAILLSVLKKQEKLRILLNDVPD